MKNLLLIVVLVLTKFGFGQDTGTSVSPCLTIEGTITKPAIYIQNPEDGDGNGFCVDSVFVNNIPLSDTIFQSSAFEINFLDFDLREGNQVTINIYHKNGCKPMILNGGGCGFQPRNGVQFIEIKVD